MDDIELEMVIAWLRDEQLAPGLFRASSPVHCPIAAFVVSTLRLPLGWARSHLFFTRVDGPSGCSCLACGGFRLEHNPLVTFFIHNLDLRYASHFVRREEVLSVAEEVLNWWRGGEERGEEIRIPVLSTRRSRFIAPRLTPVRSSGLLPDNAPGSTT